ncbi:2Fe-2S iron-sulfur cluster-binding protein [Actinoplanes couchii]|uniref:2Fe-2S iron-sulfur cluster binding domain-containing protein n=1 Tax=Actinoplanes couchii TaxID=403638 RepID=A0ABQ3XMQ9_9ACTN|nr:2Fe-2S iron-sulfur cluster-binding protein [Actinoplanes couchii]MDR6321612.1 ferredoxin-NADP reductase/predicted pyridoxine 5'-phosphate oxidase superfamily flavin-nucleotide-binding protein [Actinoplanes couchii]GID59707.1 hypothetical protein Aco03nite_081110 [Actinoplanes couchii]
MSSKNKSILTTVQQVEAVVGRPAAVVMRKQISALDDGCRLILERSPVAALGYRDGAGVSTTAFVGGRPGFARMASPTRIVFDLPPGARGPVSLFFLLPGVGEVLRVNGTTTGAEVTVAEAFVHCAQAVLRSRLWQAPAPAAPAPAVPGDGPLAGPGVARFLAAAPFLAVSTWDGRGGSDTSPRGDQGAVARILDGRTLVIADRKGNKRADTLHNLLSDDRLSMAALVPGRGAVLRLRGRGALTDDPELLATLALRGMPPHAALVVDVEHAEVSEGGAVTEARLWSPGGHVVPGEMPDMMVLASRHLAAGTRRGGGLLRAVAAIPGIDRLLNRLMAGAYRSSLRKEGYADGTLREVRVAAVRRETPSAVTLVLADPAGGTFDFRPGQFFTLVTEVGGKPVRRAYSASSAPGSKHLEVTVKRVEGGLFSTHAHRLRAGSKLALLGPSGTFHLHPSSPSGPRPPTLSGPLPSEPAGPISTAQAGPFSSAQAGPSGSFRPESAVDVVLVAAGSGVTPMMSMIRARLAGPELGRTALLLSNRDETEIIFAAELARLAAGNPDRLSVTHVLTRRDGRLDAPGVRRWLAEVAPAEDAHYYVCGPEPLMDIVRSLAPDKKVHSERYAAGPVTVATEPQEMTVRDSGVMVGSATVEPGQTLLDAGLAAGLPMPYSCTAGGCGECAVRLVEGEVTRTESDGTVLACVTCPLSAVKLDIGA